MVYEIIKLLGLGMPEYHNEYHSTGLLYYDKEAAIAEADRLWKANTTEADRNSGWCSLHYVVKDREVI